MEGGARVRLRGGRAKGKRAFILTEKNDNDLLFVVMMDLDHAVALLYCKDL